MLLAQIPQNLLVDAYRKFRDDDDDDGTNRVFSAIIDRAVLRLTVSPITREDTYNHSDNCRRAPSRAGSVLAAIFAGAGDTSAPDVISSASSGTASRFQFRLGAPAGLPIHPTRSHRALVAPRITASADRARANGNLSIGHGRLSFARARAQRRLAHLDIL